MFHILFIHSSFDGHLDSFWGFFAIINNSAINRSFCRFCGHMCSFLLGSGELKWNYKIEKEVYVEIFKKLPKCFPKCALALYISTSNL